VTISTSTATVSQSRPFRSTIAVAAGFLSVAVLSLATDQLLHVLDVYPPWGEPMWEPSLNLLALSYRTVYAIVGGYITAMLAPHAAMRQVKIVAVLGLIAATAGAITAITLADFGPNWYPIALAVTAFHTVWIGGRLHESRHRVR
jgi:hypothetical protein